MFDEISKVKIPDGLPPEWAAPVRSKVMWLRHNGRMLPDSRDKETIFVQGVPLVLHERGGAVQVELTSGAKELIAQVTAPEFRKIEVIEIVDMPSGYAAAAEERGLDVSRFIPPDDELDETVIHVDDLPREPESFTNILCVRLGEYLFELKTGANYSDTMNFAQANAHLNMIRGLNLGGTSNWFLPTAWQLQLLSDSIPTSGTYISSIFHYAIVLGPGAGWRGYISTPFGDIHQQVKYDAASATVSNTNADTLLHVRCAAFA